MRDYKEELLDEWERQKSEEYNRARLKAEEGAHIALEVRWWSEEEEEHMHIEAE